MTRSFRIGASALAYDWFHEAMECYARAETMRAPGNDDAVLRWNTCARFLMDHPNVQPEPQMRAEPILSE